MIIDTLLARRSKSSERRTCGEGKNDKLTDQELGCQSKTVPRNSQVRYMYMERFIHSALNTDVFVIFLYSVAVYYS